MASSSSSQQLTIMASSSSPQLSDNDDYFFGEPREMTKEEEIEYSLAFKKTEGFDMPSFRDSYADGRIEPIFGSRLYSKELQECADRAIDYYNERNGTSFEFVKMVRATNKAVVGIMYYTTFEVKQIGTPQNSPTKKFQARVLRGIPKDDDDDGWVVELCRDEPILLLDEDQFLSRHYDMLG